MPTYKASITYKLGTATDAKTSTWSFSGTNTSLSDTALLPSLTETFEKITNEGAPVTKGALTQTFERSELGGE